MKMTYSLPVPYALKSMGCPENFKNLRQKKEGSTDDFASQLKEWSDSKVEEILTNEYLNFGLSPYDKSSSSIKAEEFSEAIEFYSEHCIPLKLFDSDKKEIREGNLSEQRKKKIETAVSKYNIENPEKAIRILRKYYIYFLIKSGWIIYYYDKVGYLKQDAYQLFAYSLVLDNIIQGLPNEFSSFDPDWNYNLVVASKINSVIHNYKNVLSGIAGYESIDQVLDPCINKIRRNSDYKVKRTINNLARNNFGYICTPKGNCPGIYVTNPLKATTCGDYLFWPSIEEMENVIIKYLSTQTPEVSKSKRSNKKGMAKTDEKGYKRKVASEYLKNYPGEKHSKIKELIKEKEGVDISLLTISRAKKDIKDEKV